MSDLDLRHCPHPPCRSDRLGVELLLGVKHWKVVCTSCGMTGPGGYTPKEAIEHWNNLPRRYLQLAPDETMPY